MNSTPDSTDVTVTTGVVSSWLSTPMIVALLFAMAGAIFIGIYILRRIRKPSGTENLPPG
jgi:hypothetical protein